MHAGIVSLSLPLVIERLGLPADTLVLSVRLDPFDAWRLQLAVSHASLDPVPEGGMLPPVRPTEDGRGFQPA